jgi:hypothetical protein
VTGRRAEAEAEAEQQQQQQQRSHARASPHPATAEVFHGQTVWAEDEGEATGAEACRNANLTQRRTALTPITASQAPPLPPWHYSRPTHSVQPHCFALPTRVCPFTRVLLLLLLLRVRAPIGRASAAASDLSSSVQLLTTRQALLLSHCCIRKHRSALLHCSIAPLFPLEPGGEGEQTNERANERTNLADRKCLVDCRSSAPLLALAGDDARKPSSTRFRPSIFVIGLTSPHLTRKSTRQSH